ncbi:Mx2, Mx-like dynamin-related GTPase [Tribonema minus]|uniref:Mx2, Mx-like dynamin-related GTPase n=1 Tax=Tribonema minus TaxID=303371 RepID=A0A835Z0L1_9STRA|nr:Mx2, Mx-like dynamin-related GTPase [Tribonema minus]
MSSDDAEDSSASPATAVAEDNNTGEASSIEQGIQRDVRPWLNLVDDLSNLTHDTEISVPQICVMGDQSSGKSSVLESLSGIPFPRGSGLVTRCPIRLSMKRTAAGSAWIAHAHTSSSPGDVKRAETPAHLTALMEALTDTLTSNFSTESINVKVTAPGVPDLTVVDLPGIIRTSTAGQDPRMIQQVNALIDSFLMQERTIILCVIPANQDIATVDILERALKVDPSGERTIGVLTKPDLIGPGNEDEVMAVLLNVRKPLQLGYTMLRNRTQKELAAGASAAEAKRLEQEFFKAHPHFKSCDPKLFGIDNLTSRLTQLLVTRIQAELVPMKAEVESALASVRAELKTLSGYGAARGPAERQKLLVTITQEYVRHLTSVVQGEYRDRVIVVHPQLRLYTRALGVFEELRGKVEDTAPPFSDENFVQILAAQMDSLRGRELPGFMSAQSFYMFMAQYVEAWREPARAAAAEVRALTLEVASRLLEVLVVQYPALREAVRGVARRVLEEAHGSALQALDDLLRKEKDPFTVNDFLEQHINKLRYDRFETAVAAAFQELQGKATADKAGWAAAKENVGQALRRWYRATHGVNSASNAEDMSAILEAYWLLAAKRFVDNACMTLDKVVMGDVARRMQEECYRFVQDDERLSRFFEEDGKLLARKHELTERRDRLSKASAAMANIQVRNGRARPVRVTVTAGQLGLGLSLAEDGGRVVVKGFRPMPDGHRNPGQEAGVKLGDVLEQVEGHRLGSFQEAIERLKRSRGTVVLTLLRERG